jgi:hypothetical protein
MIFIEKSSPLLKEDLIKDPEVFLLGNQTDEK